MTIVGSVGVQGKACASERAWAEPEPGGLTGFCKEMGQSGWGPQGTRADETGSV